MYEVFMMTKCSVSDDTPKNINSKKRFIKISEVCKITSFSKTEIYKRTKEGRFPQRVPLGGRSVAWLESEVLEWIDQQVALRNERA